MSMISISHLSFCYDGSFDPIFEDVSIQLDTDWKLGFIGRNGRGKTTLLKLLQGGLSYTGTIHSSVQFDYFPFEVTDSTLDALSVIEEISGKLPLWQIQRELSLLQVDSGALYRPFDTLSNGERSKMMLAALFLKENNFLLIDEPTNHLDSEARQAVSRYLKRKSGFILVSHDRTFLDGCIDHVLSINRLNIELQKGNYSSWQKNKELRDEFERSQNEKLKQEIKSLSDAARRTSNWSDQVEKTKKGTRNSGLRPDRGFIGHKAAKMMKRSKAIEARKEQAVEEKSHLLKNIDIAQDLKLCPLAFPKEVLISADGISVNYGERTVCGPLGFEIRRGDRIALQGKNGSGKTSLIKLILGEDIPHSGSIKVANNLVISYVSQDTSFLRGGLKEFAWERGLDETLFKAILRKLDFSRMQFEKKMEDYSEGQKKKVLLAASLTQPAHLYLWDEPLNYIDLLSRIQIEELLLSCQPTMLFVEHDSCFTEKIANRVIPL